MSASVKARDPNRCNRGWRIALLVACTVGVCLSADLARLHVKVNTDPAYHSYCAMSERVNCETVAASDYSVVMGLPLAVWGLLGYLGVAGLVVWGLRRRDQGTWPGGLVFWASAAYFVLGLVLFAVSHFLIESICIVCTGTYLVNFFMLLAAFMDLRSSGFGPVAALKADLERVAGSTRPFAVYLGLFVLVVAGLEIGMPRYWEVKLQKGPGGLGVGFTEDGDPWIGAERPVMVITEFSDYQCPHCKRGHAEMRRLMQSHPKRLRLVHRHYPLDNECNPVLRRPFHPYSCFYSRLAYCSGKQGKFWEANDYLFSNGRRKRMVTAEELAGVIGVDATRLTECAGSDEARNMIARDLAAGRKANVRGTPTFVVNGKSYPGRIPDYVLDSILGRAGEKGAGGAGDTK